MMKLASAGGPPAYPGCASFSPDGGAGKGVRTDEGAHGPRASPSTVRV